MNQKHIKMYSEIADVISNYSHAKKLKVGSIIVKENRIISIGINGTPSGWDNNCEDVLEDGTLKTKPEVIHSEMNCLAKLAKSPESGENAVMFITHSPCFQCAKGIYSSGIIEVYYKHDYRCDGGIKFLQKCGIKITKLEV